LRSNLKFSRIETASNTEQVWVSLKINNESLAVGVVYRSPTINYRYFCDELEKF